MSKIKKAYYLLLAFCCWTTISFTQDPIKKEVFVVKPYEPSVSDAYKLNDMPVLDDSLKIKPSVSYYVIPYELQAPYATREIKAAKMLGMPISKLYKTYLRAGMGTYTTPMVEAFFNSERSKDYSYGIHGFHQSSFGKVKLDNKEKVYAGYNDSRLDLFGKWFFPTNELSANINYNANAYQYYGYNTDTIVHLDKKNNKQKINDLSLTTRIRSTYMNDSSTLNYDGTLNFQSFSDAFSHSENILSLNADLDKYLLDNKLGVYVHWNKYFFENDSFNNTLVNFRPYLSRFGNIWRVYAGIDFYNNKQDKTAPFSFYPVGLLEFNVANHFVKPYLGVSGSVEVNDYQKILRENPYIIPGLHVESTVNQLSMFIGLRGKYSPKLQYNFRYNYAVIDNMYFYVNDSSTFLLNRFNVVYKDIEYSNYFAEITFTESENLEFIGSFNHHVYKLIDPKDKPWHKPGWDASIAGRYKFKNKINLITEIIGKGKKYALLYDRPNPVEIPALLDVNLGIEYLYSKVLSAFLQLNNLSSSRYSTWYLYPQQQFNLMIGLTYAM